MVFGMRQGHAQEKGHERQASQVHKAACARLSPLFGVWKRFPPLPSAMFHQLTGTDRIDSTFTLSKYCQTVMALMQE